MAHLETCKSKEEGQKEIEAIERRMILCKRASRELKLKRSTTANSPDEEGSSTGTSCRKRSREIVDEDPENMHQQRRTEEDHGSALVAISSSYQTLVSDDVATGKISTIAADVLLMFP